MTRCGHCADCLDPEPLWCVMWGIPPAVMRYSITARDARRAREGDT